MDRRDFLKTLGIVGAATVVGKPLRAEEAKSGKEFMGVLVDTTRCIGCRSCEESCADANGMPAPDLSDAVLEQHRMTSETQWTVINRFQSEDNTEIFVKKQCMHCGQPACVSACLTKALEKTKDGPVIWHPSKCMGCRFCMISCPFEIPKFEYHSNNPKIQKCIMCQQRLKAGEPPACVENCPAEALTFGTRRELIEIANQRIYQNPDQYIHHIYGELEVGGTEWLYLAAVPFEKLGFRTDLGNKAYPEYTTNFLYAVPFVDIILPALLLGISQATKAKRPEESEDGHE